MKEEMYGGDDMGDSVPALSKTPGGRHAISFGSQMLAVGAGFCVFIMLLALFAAVQHRKRRRSSILRSPLIHKSTSASLYGRQATQAIPPPPQYLRCSNQCLRKCSSPGGSDYSLSSSYSSSACSARSLSPISPYGPHHQIGSYNNNLMHPQQMPMSMSMPQQQQQQLLGSPFAGINFIPYGTSPSTQMFNNGGSGTALSEKRHSFTTTTTTTAIGNGENAIPELIIDAERGRGSISLQLAYDANNLALQITVLACNGLPKFANIVGCNSISLNPYIKLRLLPEGQHRVKTRILRDTQDPIFDEAFNMYGLSAEHLRNCQLHLAALAFDRYNGDTVLGEAVYDLADFCASGPLSNIPKNVSLKWENRQPFEGQKRGKARVALSFEPTERKVRFALLQMSDLPKDATLGLLDPYAKIYALVNGQKRVAKHKTRVLKRTQCPQFSAPDDWLEFTLPENVGFDTNGVPNALSIQVVVFNHDGVKRNEPVGQFTIDAESELFVLAFQQQQQQKNGSHHTEWHTILPF